MCPTRATGGGTRSISGTERLSAEIFVAGQIDLWSLNSQLPSNSFKGVTGIGECWADSMRELVFATGTAH